MFYSQKIYLVFTLSWRFQILYMVISLRNFLSVLKVCEWNVSSNFRRIFSEFWERIKRLFKKENYLNKPLKESKRLANFDDNKMKYCGMFCGVYIVEFHLVIAFGSKRAKLSSLCRETSNSEGERGRKKIKIFIFNKSFHETEWTIIYNIVNTKTFYSVHRKGFLKIRILQDHCGVRLSVRRQFDILQTECSTPVRYGVMRGASRCHY